MARKLASVVEISEILPIEGADKLELAKMKGKGWQVVVQKGEFNVGDLCVYFEIDSFLNPEDERYAFLKDRCLRRFVSKSGNVLREGLKIKTIKLRGQISQGLLMPLEKFPEICGRLAWKEEGAYSTGGWRVRDVNTATWFIAETKAEYDKRVSESDIPSEQWKAYNEFSNLVPILGADVTALLHVEHYDEVKESLQPEMGNPICADALGRFPSDYIPKTDEERIQNLGDWFEKMKGRVWQVSCKHDGTSCTIAYSKMIDEGNPEIVCSRNLRLKPESADGKVPVYWQMAKQYDVLAKLKRLAESVGIEYAVQGEIVGPGINKCKNKEKTYKFLVFRIYDITNQKWVNPTDTVQMCKSLGLEHVQIVKDDFAFFDEIKTMDEALKFAEGKTAEGNEREGVVLKTIDSLPYASFKIVSNRYLMKQED